MLHRLTDKDHRLAGYGWGDVSEGQCISRSLQISLVNALDRLGEYEDTGLKPWEIKSQGECAEEREEAAQYLYAIIFDDVAGGYIISKHRITDICASGTIITDGKLETEKCEIWTPKTQAEYHVCFSIEKAKRKVDELEDGKDRP